MGIPERITSISVRGFKSLVDVTLRLGDDVTVLIGDNGVGKSAIVEACEILRRATHPQPLQDLAAVHGMPLTLSLPEAQFGIELAATATLPALRYRFRLRRTGFQLVFAGEELHLLDGGGWIPVIEHADGRVIVVEPTTGSQQAQSSADRLAVASFVGREATVPTLSRVMEALTAIDIQTPFPVSPAWTSSKRVRSALREPSLLMPTSALERGGGNVVSAFYALRERGKESWSETLALVQLGLGDDVEDIKIQLDAGGGHAALAIKRRALSTPLAMSQLSDGTLAYLCFVALHQLRPARSLLVFDEPELHLHPRLVDRVMSLFSSMAFDHPVLLATHSDRILDLLPEPAEQAVLARLDLNDATVLERPNADALKLWADAYRGLGAIRADGHENSVFVDGVGT